MDVDIDMMAYNYTYVDDDVQQTAESLSLTSLRFFLSRVFYPCLLILGTIGNALCLRVLLSKKFVKNSTCQYLAVLAVIDILFIIMRSSKHVNMLFLHKSIFNTSQWSCRILTFLSSALAHLASWILVIVSVDRYLIVTSRYRRQSSTASRVLCSTGILVVIVALCNLYYFYILGRHIRNDEFSSNTQPHHSSNEALSADEVSLENAEPLSTIPPQPVSTFFCIPSQRWERFFGTYIPVFDILLVAVIPFFLLCCTNIGIITYTMRSNRRMRQHRKRTHRRHQRLTIMLLSVTLAFIGLTCPSVIIICVNKILYFMESWKAAESSGENGLTPLRESPSVQWLIEVCEALWYTKHAMNFVLYTLSGQDFRREFLKLFTQCCHNRPSILKKKLTSATQTTFDRSLNSTLTEVPMAVDICRKGNTTTAI